MTKPRNFILNPDYATLKNDNLGSLSINITDSGILPYDTYIIYESYLTIGTINAGVRCQLRSTALPDVYCALGFTVPVTVTAYISGTPVDVSTYNLPVVIERSSASQVRLYSKFYSYGVGVDMRITAGYQTVTADIATFLSPFN